MENSEKVREENERGKAEEIAREISMDENQENTNQRKMLSWSEIMKFTDEINENHQQVMESREERREINDNKDKEERILVRFMGDGRKKDHIDLQADDNAKINTKFYRVQRENTVKGFFYKELKVINEVQIIQTNWN